MKAIYSTIYSPEESIINLKKSTVNESANISVQNKIVDLKIDKTIQLLEFSVIENLLSIWTKNILAKKAKVSFKVTNLDYLIYMYFNEDEKFALDMLYADKYNPQKCVFNSRTLLKLSRNLDFRNPKILTGLLDPDIVLECYTPF